MKHKSIKALPNYLQPKILSAVAYVHETAPNLDKAVERINTLSKHLNPEEIKWVLSLLAFEKLLDMVGDSDEFKNHVSKIQERTIN